MSDHDRKAARRKSERAGRRAEWIAAAMLLLKGYRILKMRHRTHSGEIDIIAKRGRLVAFVEVKNRRAMDDALNAVTFKARRRIERAADMFVAMNAPLAGCDMRYDIVAVSARRIRHIRCAWRAGE